MKKDDKASISLKKVISISIILLFVMGIGVMAASSKLNNVKIILSDGYEMDVLTSKTKISEILDENHIIMLPNEKVIPGLDEEIPDNKTITSFKDLEELKTTSGLVDVKGEFFNLKVTNNSELSITANKNIELKEEINNLSSEVINATYFIEPNILKMNYSDIEKFYLKNEKLKEYERYLQEMFRYKEHTLSDIEEKLLANLSKTFGNNYETYELLKDSDMIFPNFMVNNIEYELDNSKYCLYIEEDNREIRKEAFNTIYETFKQCKNVYANLITSNIVFFNVLDIL